MVYKKVPAYLKNLVPPRVHQVTKRQLRSVSNIHIPSARTNIYQNSFIPRTSKDWNTIPSLPQFKRYLDKIKFKVSPYYYIGDRRCQILHARLRFGCSSLNHLSETDKCTSGEPETAQHYFFQCANFKAVRAETIQSLPYQINIEITLKGCPLYTQRHKLRTAYSTNDCRGK